jgi:hypothetical protein
MDARELEVRCARCNAGFAIGTRVCIHCSQPIGRGLLGEAPLPAAAGDDAELDAPQEPQAPPTLWARLGPGLVALVFVALSVLSRACLNG